MKYYKAIIYMLLLSMGLSSCNQKHEENTPETMALLSNLKEVAGKGILFGHHDDTVYGIGWEGDKDRSDIKSVCGAFPAVISFDLGEIELGNEHNLDKVSFNRLRECALDQYLRGGVVSFSWHARNPKTGGDAWDNSDSTVVASILPGGEHHQKMLSWLDTVSEFFVSLKTAEGTLVPVIFRPWHEHTGSWFWWGQALCTSEEYKQLWQMTDQRLRQNGVKNVLLAYSPGMEPNSVEEYLERYPGDDLIDVIGTDIYQYDSLQYKEQLDKELAIMTTIGKQHDKPIALTETGLEGIPDSTWWTQTLLPIVSKYPLSYMLVWRNAREKVTHYYAPYPGQVSADDFVEFYNSPKTLFIGDDFELYK